MLSPILTLNCSCNIALLASSRRLAKRGLRVLQTFDLHTTSQVFEGCSCPNHATSECDCQMVVLLVYGEAAEPATLVLHGNNGKTWVSIPDSTVHPVDGALRDAIETTLQSLSAAEG